MARTSAVKSQPGGDNSSMEKSGVVDTVVEVRQADDVRLAELGYKGEFRREFSVGGVCASLHEQPRLSMILRCLKP